MKTTTTERMLLRISAEKSVNPQAKDVIRFLDDLDTLTAENARLAALVERAKRHLSGSTLFMGHYVKQLDGSTKWELVPTAEKALLDVLSDARKDETGEAE